MKLSCLGIIVIKMTSDLLIFPCCYVEACSYKLSVFYITKYQIQFLQQLFIYSTYYLSLHFHWNTFDHLKHKEQWITLHQCQAFEKWSLRLNLINTSKNEQLIKNNLWPNITCVWLINLFQLILLVTVNRF